MSKKFKKTILVVLSSLFLIAGAIYLAGYFLFGYFINFLFKTSDSGLQSLPCAPASQVELGYPSEGGEAAEFTTNGSKLFIQARYFNHGGLFGSLPGSTAINVGLTATPPVLNAQRNIIANTTKTINAWENKYSEFILSAGSYWLWTSAGGDIVIYSCDPNGVSDPKPVGQTTK